MKATSSRQQKKIISAIKKVEIAPFIISEIKDTIKHLNDFKLSNILKNISMLLAFCKDLDNRNTKMYKTNPKRGKTSNKNTTPDDKYISTH